MIDKILNELGKLFLSPERIPLDKSRLMHYINRQQMERIPDKKGDVWLPGE